MNVSIAPEQKRFIAGMVKSGRYVTSSEVVREGLRLLQQREEIRREYEEEVRRKIREGLDALERGEYEDFNDATLKEFFDRIKREGRIRLKSRRGRK
jgi:antitoxin ParD1/3/4